MDALIAQSPIAESSYGILLQAGFAGFALVLLIFLYCIVRDNSKDRKESNVDMVNVLRDNNRVIADNTNIISRLKDSQVESNSVLRDVRDRLLERPCLMPRRNDPPGIQGM